MPKVSVIMPVYNTKEIYLRQAIESVLTQTFTDFEFIIVNDGSIESVVRILDEYVKKDNRIIVIHQRNKGQSVARNSALNIAQGEYISFVDSDDFIHKQMLELLVITAEKTKLDVVALDSFNHLSKNETFNQVLDLSNLQYTIHSEPLEHLLSNIRSSSVIWDKIYRKDIIQNKRFIEGIYFEDWPFITCLFSDLDKYVTIPYPLYNYNDVLVSTMRSTFTLKKLNDYMTGIMFIHQYFQQPKFIKYWPIVRKKRITASIKMMINKTYKENTNQKKLDKALLQILCDLECNECFYWKELPLKVLFRLFKIKLRNLERNDGKI